MRASKKEVLGLLGFILGVTVFGTSLMYLALILGERIGGIHV